jgi:hypothetical protein
MGTEPFAKAPESSKLEYKTRPKVIESKEIIHTEERPSK